MAKSKKYKNQNRRRVTFKEMRAYIAKNLTAAVRKLKRWEKNELYKGSPTMQTARKDLRYMYKRYGFDETSYHSGKIFQSKITSYEELKVLYGAVQRIQGANARDAREQLESNTKSFERAKEIWKALGKDVSDISYSQAFDTLSYLSQEFHELFAILTYNEVQVALAQSDSPIDVFHKYAKRLENKVLTEKQKEYSKKLNEKIYDSDMSSLDIAYIFNNRF